MSTLEDLDRRVTALEKAQSAVDAIIPAIAGMISESERRTADRVSASERRIIDVVNDKFDAVMVALDRLKG